MAARVWPRFVQQLRNAIPGCLAILQWRRKKGKLCFGYPSADDVDVEKCWDLLERTRAGGGFFHCT